MPCNSQHNLHRVALLYRVVPHQHPQEGLPPRTDDAVGVGLELKVDEGRGRGASRLEQHLEQDECAQRVGPNGCPPIRLFEL